MNLKASPEAIRIKAIGIFPLKKTGYTGQKIL
jgi:hypothetical protein